MGVVKFSTWILLVLSVLSILFSCKKEEEGKADGAVVVEGAPIEVIDGKVTFIVKCPFSLNGASVKVNSQPYTVQKDGAGKEYIKVNASSFGDYAAEYVPSDAGQWCSGTSAEKDIFLPHGQFHGTTAKDLQTMPQFALYREETGNVLNFCGPYATVRLSCTGSGKLASVSAECSKGAPAGQFDYDPYTGTARVSRKLSRVVLNCMRDGGAPMNGDFTIAVVPGDYKGLKLNVVSTDHRRCVVDLGDITLSGGQTVERSLAWNPGDNLFYEGFDTFVWGGDIMGGSTSVGYAPDAAKPEVGTPVARTGYEYAGTIVPACTVAGASYFQEYNSGTISSIMPAEYWQSRNMADYPEVVRAQEYQGCLAIGTVSGHRGWIKIPCLNIPRFTNAKVEFDVCPCAGAVDEITFRLMNSGVLKSCLVGGKDCLKDISLRKSPNIDATLDRTSVAIPSSATSSKKWTHVEAIVENASDNTAIQLISSTSESGYHTFYVDNICVSKAPDTYQGDTYRLIYWNILYGMATDSDNNYDNWVEWVSSYSPDICVWCEARSNAKENYYLPAAYPTLAARYGHNNCVGTGTYHMKNVSGAGTEGFPQEVTSRYSLTKIKDVTYSANIMTEDSSMSTRVSHGGGLVEVNLNGRKIYVVALHLIPRTTATRDAMDEYQENEIRTILEATVLNPEYSAQKDWIMCGDFNSQSPADKWYYDQGSTSPVYRAHSYILSHTDLIDCVQKRYEGTFMSSTYSGGRIDYVYVSPSLYEDVVRAGALLDSFSTSYKIQDSPRSYAEYYPSDHRPIMIEIKK